MQDVTSTRPTDGEVHRPLIRVLVADDEEAVIDVLRALVGSDPSLRFVGAAHDAEQAIDLVLRERPDVVLLDVRMPGGGGMRAAREISLRCPPTKIVALSAHEDADTVIGMIAAGAHGYVPKGDPTDKILRTIHRAAGGRRSPRGGKPDLMVIPSTPRREERAASVARAIIDGAITTEFAPIVDIDTGRTVGLQAQPRLATLPHRSYDAWCADAQAAGLLTDLEIAAFRSCRLALRQLPDEIFLELEVSSSTASEARFRRGIQKATARRIVLGFSPSGGGGPRNRDTSFTQTLAALRTKGIRVTAAEAGTGLSGLGHLTELAPDFVRLDETLTRSVDTSFPSHSIVAAVAACAAQVGARVIAAGVASHGQLDEMRRLGVHLVQGPLVGESFPVSELSERFPVRGIGPSSSPAPGPKPEGDVAPSSTSTPGRDA